MALYSNYKIKEREKFVVLLKYFAFLFYIWIYHTYNDGNALDKSLGNIYKKNITWNINFKRLLAKHEIKKELRNVSLREKLPHDVHSSYQNMRKNDTSTYKMLKNKGLSDLEIYNKAFKCKYAKKRGLEKFDCRCEKIIFDKLDNICQLAKNMKNEKKVFNKTCKMYGLPFCVFGLFAFSAGIILSLEHYFNIDWPKPDNNTLKKCIPYVGDILFYMLPIIILIVLLYIRVKVKKYIRLSEGKTAGKRIAKKISYYYDNVSNAK
ncbi:Plasmodium exported protein, unknown function [Plasmodium vivax]|uniref:Variable surface protein Vir35 n=1 Tax=Plasmodium vivax TaxID=5855 RepID=A0A1G4EAX7_PLAVI|nr:Plasmodium exported protein, unknown function [Plasmodium vivax]VUZ99965.1 Plasmodium exported protein, unknown function [Plasmodium vivax]